MQNIYRNRAGNENKNSISCMLTCCDDLELEHMFALHITL